MIYDQRNQICRYRDVSSSNIWTLRINQESKTQYRLNIFNYWGGGADQWLGGGGGAQFACG